MIIPATVLMLMCIQCALSGTANQPTKAINAPKIMDPTTNKLSSYNCDNRASASREIDVLQRLISALLNHTTVNAETNNLQRKLEASEKENKTWQEENNLLSQNSSECYKRTNSLSAELAFANGRLQELKVERNELSQNASQCVEKTNNLSQDLQNLQVEKKELSQNSSQCVEKTNSLSQELRKLQVERNELSQNSSQCVEKTNSLSKDLQNLEEENEKFNSDAFSLMPHIHIGQYEAARKIYYSICDTTLLNRIMRKTETANFDTNNLLLFILNLTEIDCKRELNNLYTSVNSTDFLDLRKWEIAMQKDSNRKCYEAIPDMTAEVEQMMSMFAKDSYINTSLIKFRQFFNFFSNDFIKMLNFFETMNSTEFSAIGYFTLYNYLDNTQSFNLCDRIQLLTAVNNLMGSPNFTSVSKSTQEKLSALVEGLPQSLRGLTGGNSLHISDRNGTASLVMGEAEQIVDYYNLRHVIHVSTDINPTNWTFVPQPNKPCEFKIRNGSSNRYILYAHFHKYTADQRQVYVSPFKMYAVWRLKDFDWRNDLYTLYNIHYDGNLNIDVKNKFAYTSIEGRKDDFNVVKLHKN